MSLAKIISKLEAVQDEDWGELADPNKLSIFEHLGASMSNWTKDCQDLADTIGAYTGDSNKAVILLSMTNDGDGWTVKLGKTPKQRVLRILKYYKGVANG